MDEKGRLAALANGYSDDISNSNQQRRFSRRAKSIITFLVLVVCVCLNINIALSYFPGSTSQDAESSSTPNDLGERPSQCPAQWAIPPRSNPDITERNIKTLFPSSEFRNLTVQRLSGAVQIPTVSYDDNGPIGEDPRWEVFFDLEQYFRDTFPLL
jgi:Gly-Xaa carboxypeptidase